MRRPTTVLSVILSALLAACVTGAVAIGKVTVDPNTRDKVVKRDARVSQKITYSAKRQFVYRILADLSARTGVTLSAGFSDQDWQVRDRRMTILVKDLALRDLMDSIARTMKFEWKTECDPAKPSYRLYMDRRAVLLVEAERKRKAERVSVMQAEARSRLLDGIDRAANGEDQERLRARDPYSYALAKSGAANGLSNLFRECPEAATAFAEGRRWTGDSKALSARAREALKGLLRSGQMLSPEESGGPFADISLDDISVLRINDHDGSNRLLVGQIGIDYYKDGCLQTRDMGLLDPQAPTAIIEGERLAAVWESSPENRGMVTDSYDEKLRDAPIPDWVNLPTETTEPIAEHPDDPDLARAIDLSTDSEVSYDQDDYVELIAGKCGLDVVAEDYVGDQPGRTFDAFRAKTVGELLGLLQDTCMCNWWKRGSIIEIRSRDWYEARQWQIPESWLERWREVFKAKGILDIDELSQIAALTWDQCLDNVLADPVLAKSESEDSELRAVINDCSEALSIYNKLTPRQKARVFTEKGLDLTSVRNWKSLSGELWTDSNGITSLIMRGTKQRAGKSWAYQLRITSAEAGETKDIMDCRAITPVY